MRRDGNFPSECNSKDEEQDEKQKQEVSQNLIDCSKCMQNCRLTIKKHRYVEVEQNEAYRNYYVLYSKKRVVVEIAQQRDEAVYRGRLMRQQQISRVQKVENAFIGARRSKGMSSGSVVRQQRQSVEMGMYNAKYYTGAWGRIAGYWESRC